MTLLLGRMKYLGLIENKFSDGIDPDADLPPEMGPGPDGGLAHVPGGRLGFRGDVGH